MCIRDSTYVEQLQAQGYPIRWIDETKYGAFVNDEDVNLYYDALNFACPYILHHTLKFWSVKTCSRKTVVCIGIGQRQFRVFPDIITVSYTHLDVYKRQV